MRTMRKRLWQLLIGATIVALACGSGACNSVGGLGAAGNASISFVGAGAPRSLPSRETNDTTKAGGHSVVLSRVELQVSEIEIKGDGNLEAEMKGGTTVIALPVNGSVVTPITASVFAGTYDEFEIKVQSARIIGTFDGAPFDASVNVNDELEMDLQPPLVATENGTINVTVSISFANWFHALDGTLIDPRALTDLLRARLVSNIRASFEAFQDHDRDGRSDDHDGR